MLKTPKLKFYFFAVFVTSFFSSNAQSLKFDDIFKAYSLDSIALKKLCLENKFHLTNIERDSHMDAYRFQSDSSKDVYFEKTFPTDNNNKHFFLYYNFSNRVTYKILKKEIKAKGFRLEKYYAPFPEIPEERARYNNKNLTLELCTSYEYSKPKYTLLIFRKIDNNLP